VLAKRVYNLREGWTRAEDRLPDRFLSEPLTLESGREAALTPARLHAMIDAYYAGRGLDPEGRPEPGVSAELDLDLFRATPEVEPANGSASP